MQNANRRCTGHATMSTKHGNYRLITVHAPFPTITPNGKSLSDCCMEALTESLTGEKFRKVFSMEFYQKLLLPTSVTRCAFIALRKFYSDHSIKHFCEFPNNIWFLFLLQKVKPTESATIVLTLWIYRTEDELQSCILVRHQSNQRCMHCSN